MKIAPHLREGVWQTEGPTDRDRPRDHLLDLDGGGKMISATATSCACACRRERERESSEGEERKVLN